MNEINEELVARLYDFYQHSREAEEQLKIIEQQISELQRFEFSLEDLEKSKTKEILASIGKGVFIKSDIKEEKLFVDVGSGILIRKGMEEAKDIIREQNKRIGEMKIQLMMEKESVDREIANLVWKIERVKKGEIKSL